MNDVICKIVKSIIELQKQGIAATFELNTTGDILVFLDGRTFDSIDIHPISIYAQIMDLLTTIEFEKEVQHQQ